MNLFRLLLLALALQPAALRAEDLVSGCVWIRAENDGSGSGFLVDAKKKWVVTCRHVVGERDRVDVYFAWKKDGSLVTEKADYLGNRDLLRERKLLVTGSVLKKSDEADLALVELDSLPESVTALSLASAAVQPGDSLRVVGHRIDLDTLFNLTTGPVRQTGRLANGYPWRGKKLAVNADAILGQLPIEEGDSGGPVLNAKGELVGMVSALRRQVPTAAIAISGKEIRKFLTIAEPKAAQAKLGIGDTLMRATVWVRPGFTDFRTAGALIAKDLILTSNRGVGPANWVGVAFPILNDGKWTSEVTAYRDPIELHEKEVWEVAEVIARDPDRDLALLRIFDRGSEWMRPLKLASREPAIGEAIHSMSHPGGVEFAWVYASGSIRQHGRLALADGEKPVRVRTNALQLPAQSASPGGPVVNDAGELVGIVAARESTQQTGYAASWTELDHFLNAYRSDLPARSLAAMLSRAEARWQWGANRFASALRRSSQGEKEARLRLALLLNPKSVQTRIDLFEWLIESNRSEEADAELDHAVNSVGDPYLHARRAERRIAAKNWQGALGDLQQALAVTPDNGDWHRMRFRVLLELKKDDEAAAAVGDALRTHPCGLWLLAKDFLEQAEGLAKKFPETPSIPANWLKLAIGAGAKFDPLPERRKKCEVVLKAAAAAPDDTARLRILRDFLELP